MSISSINNKIYNDLTTNYNDLTESQNTENFLDSLDYYDNGMKLVKIIECFNQPIIIDGFISTQFTDKNTSREHFKKCSIQLKGTVKDINKVMSNFKEDIKSYTYKNNILTIILN